MLSRVREMICQLEYNIMCYIINYYKYYNNSTPVIIRHNFFFFSFSFRHSHRWRNRHRRQLTNTIEGHIDPSASSATTAGSRESSPCTLYNTATQYLNISSRPTAAHVDSNQIIITRSSSLWFFFFLLVFTTYVFFNERVSVFFFFLLSRYARVYACRTDPVFIP